MKRIASLSADTCPPARRESPGSALQPVCSPGTSSTINPSRAPSNPPVPRPGRPTCWASRGRCRQGRAGRTPAACTCAFGSPAGRGEPPFASPHRQCPARSSPLPPSWRPQTKGQGHGLARPAPSAPRPLPAAPGPARAPLGLEPPGAAPHLGGSGRGPGGHFVSFSPPPEPSAAPASARSGGEKLAAASHGCPDKHPTAGNREEEEEEEEGRGGRRGKGRGKGQQREEQQEEEPQV